MGKQVIMTRMAFIRKYVWNQSQRKIEMVVKIPHALYSALEQGRLVPYDYMTERIEGHFALPMDKLLQFLLVDMETGLIMDENPKGTPYSKNSVVEDGE